MAQWQPKTRKRGETPRANGPLFLILLALVGLGFGAVLTVAVISFSGESFPSADVPGVSGAAAVAEDVAAVGEKVGDFVEAMHGYMENRQEFTTGQFNRHSQTLGNVADPGGPGSRD
jgi:hypothetical protein